MLEKAKSDSVSSLDGMSDSEAGTSDGDTVNPTDLVAVDYMDGPNSTSSSSESFEPAVKRIKAENDGPTKNGSGQLVRS